MHAPCAFQPKTGVDVNWSSRVEAVEIAAGQAVSQAGSYDGGRAAVLNMQNMADRIIDHYERHARDWDNDRNLHVSPWNDKPWRDRFVAALPRAASVLDLGCGSGSPVAKYITECGLHVTGVDSSPTLISLCRQRLPDHQWLVDDMRSLRLPRRYDGVLAWDVLPGVR
jgi:SAM-dependent methyltransferase